MARTFQEALRKIVNDEKYKAALWTDPMKLTTDFKLSSGELGILMAVGQFCTGEEQLYRPPEGRKTNAPEGLCSSSVVCCCC